VNIAVFCSSSSKVAPLYVAAAEALGHWIGSNGHTLVWGGCNVGLMDVVGRATQAAHGRLVAVLPEFLFERGLGFEPTDERVLTADMQERKAVIRRRSDAFVALPGGVGTWEEILEVLALRKLERLDGAILLANLNGCYDPLLAQLERSVSENLNPPEIQRLLEVAASAADLLSRLVRLSSRLAKVRRLPTRD
jgi:hypothetical protein